MPDSLATIEAPVPVTRDNPGRLTPLAVHPYALVTAGLVLGVFGLDLATPAGISVWGLYFIPIWLTTRWTGDRGAAIVTGVACLLTMADWVLVGEPDLFAELDRLIGIVVLGLFGTVVVFLGRTRAAGQAADARSAVAEQRFQEFLTHLPAVAWIKGPDYRYQYINPTYQTRFALPGMEYQGKTDFDIFPAAVAAELRTNDSAVRETGVARQVVESVPTPDGIEHQWLVTKFALPNLGGETAVAGIAINITAERLAEEKFRQVFEACPAGMILVDRAGRIVLANANAERLVGCPAGELVGQDVDLFVPDWVRPSHPAYRESFFRHPQVLTQLGTVSPLSARRIDGSLVPVEIGLSPIQTADGLFALATLMDVTARTQAEAARARTAAELARSNRELEQFAYVASHDLQEPLRMVTSYLELLRDRYEAALDDKARSWIAYAVDGAERMKDLIEALLQYSRVGRRKRPFELLDLNRTAQDALLNLHAAVRESGARVEIGPLPTVRGDRVLLIQLFQNLLGNALKFRGRACPHVQVGAEKDGTNWRFAVRDNGIGIDPRYQDRLFVLFQRLHPRSRYPGTGIGLAVCQRIVERHGGRIWVESSPDCGATFYWTMPDGQEGCHEPDTVGPAEPVVVGGR